MVLLPYPGANGQMHTGPTASPENSYFLKQSKDKTFATRLVRVVTHSPTIDTAVLRQISNIYSIAVSWVKFEQHSSAILKIFLQSTEYATDQQLSERLKDMVMKMPNKAVPIATLRKKQLRNNQDQISSSPASRGFFSSLMKQVVSSQRSDNSINNEYDNLPYAKIAEYVKTPLISNRSSMMRYPYMMRPNSDR